MARKSWPERLKRSWGGLALPASASHRSRCLDEHLRDVEVTHGAQSSRRVTVLLKSHRPPNHSRVRLTLPAMRSQRVLVKEHDHLLRRACSIVCVHCLTVVRTLARTLAVSIIPCATSVRRLAFSCTVSHVRCTSVLTCDSWLACGALPAGAGRRFEPRIHHCALVLHRTPGRGASEWRTGELA